MSFATGTEHTMKITPDQEGVCSLRSKYDGEVHTLTISFTGEDLDLENGDNLNPETSNGLWKIDETFEKSKTEAKLTITTYAKEDLSAEFTVTQKKKSQPSGTGSGSTPQATGKGYANQIQIHAYLPGKPTSEDYRFPRPNNDQDPYTAILTPIGSQISTPVQLIFNSQKKSLGINTVTFSFPNTLEVLGKNWPNEKIWQGDFSTQTIQVRLKQNLTPEQIQAQNISLKLTNDLGEENDAATDEVKLCPVVIKDIDRILHSSDVSLVEKEQWSNEEIQKDIPDEQIAWITGNSSNGNPEMPKLSAVLLGAPPSRKISWRFFCEYRRGNGYRKDYSLPEDKVGIPNLSPTKFTPAREASTPWALSEEDMWKEELSQRGFFGGLAKVFCKIEGIDQDVEVARFRIGGKNPDETAARAYIDDVATPQFWYAYAIAKHETFGRVREENGKIRYYNQFYTSTKGKKIGATANDMGWVAWAKSWPLYNFDRINGVPNGPGGYGIFQLTLGKEPPEAPIQRREIWNWQDNTIGFIVELEEKYQKAITFKNRLEEYYPDLPKIEDIRTGPFDGVTALTIVLYNGAGGLPWVQTKNGNIKSCWKPINKNWSFFDNSQKYITNLKEKIEP